MSATETLLPTETIQETLFMLPHMTMLGDTTFWCIQGDCDGEHHFWCDCHASAHAG